MLIFKIITDVCIYKYQYIVTQQDLISFLTVMIVKPWILTSVHTRTQTDGRQICHQFNLSFDKIITDVCIYKINTL